MGRTPKRRKTTISAAADADVLSTEKSELRIRLSKPRAMALRLSSPIFIEIEMLEYITFNSDSAWYLYYICSSLFEVPPSLLNILYSAHKRSLDDDDDSNEWNVVEVTDRILKGDYILYFDNGAGTNGPLLFYWH